MMKILVVRYRFIGDMILTVPFLRNLRRAYPDAQIDMLVSPNSGEVIEDCPYVDNFIYFDTSRKHKYENGKDAKKSFMHYVSMLRKEKYDKAYILKRSFSSALLCYLAGIKERIGFDTEHRGFLLTKKAEYDAEKHESLCFLDVLTADGIKIKDAYLENWIKEETLNRVKNLLKENGVNEEEKFAAINAAASNPYKMWGADNFAAVIEYLSNEKGIRSVFIGASSDAELYEKMKFKGELKLKPVNLCGKINIKESLAVLKTAKFFLGNDSGSLHMAASAGTRVIGLYGPMPFEKWKALGDNHILLRAELKCMPCGLKGRCINDKACMKAVSIEAVKNAVNEILKIAV